MKGWGAVCRFLRRRSRIRAIKPPTIARKTTPPTTPPATTPAFTFFCELLPPAKVGVEGEVVGVEGEVVRVEGKVIRVEDKVVGVEGEVTSAEVLVPAAPAEVDVAGRTGVDSAPPESRISECRPMGQVNVPTLSAAVTLKKLID